MGGPNWTSAWYTETLLGLVSFTSLPTRFNESHRLKPQKPGGKGGQLPLMQIIAGWCFWHKVFILLFSSACSRMLRTICPSTQAAGHILHVQKFVCNRKISSTWSICWLRHWAESSYHQSSGTWVDGSRWIAQGYSQRISVPKHSSRNHGGI